MRRGAIFDDTGCYRYWLWRTWNTALPRVAFVMLNPSTADQYRDDSTIRRCIGFADRWGYGSLVVVNLFAYRTPSPVHLARAPRPVGPANDRYLGKARRRCRDIVLAWGNHGSLHQRDRQVLDLLGRRRQRRLLCLGTTAQGHPRHPLYLPGNKKPIVFTADETPLPGAE
ncbi:MAG: DUF1643 domain-containing protein [Proteobacteria bacterium]|nr:DUF1643 domain-containing protein [Pseudomonadota bacterium]